MFCCVGVACLNLVLPFPSPLVGTETSKTDMSIVDDAFVFLPPGVIDGRASSIRDLPVGPSNSETSIRLLNEQVVHAPWPPMSAEQNTTIDDGLKLLDTYGHRRRAGDAIAHPIERDDLSDLWHDDVTRESRSEDMFVQASGKAEGGVGSGGPYANSGPLLSPAARASLRTSLAHDAPEAVLDELRALARKPNQTGISAWRTFRDRERSSAANAANLKKAQE